LKAASTALARLPVSPQELPSWSLCVLCVFVPFVVGPLLLGYNYRLIITASHCRFQKSSPPEKPPSRKPTSPHVRPAPERSPACMHASPPGGRRLLPRLAFASGGTRPGPEGFWRKSVNSCQSFATSCCPVRSWSWPARLRPMTNACQAISPALATSLQPRVARPTGGSHERQPGPERRRT
jgi:hypothetical protein